MVVPEDYTDDKDAVGQDPADIAERQAGEPIKTPAEQLERIPGGPSSENTAAGNSADPRGDNSLTKDSISNDANANKRFSKPNGSDKTQSSSLGNIPGKTLGAISSFKGRRNLAIGGSVLAFIISIALTFFALLPLKIEHIMKNLLEQRVTNKTEHIIEKRANKIVIRYFINRYGLTSGGGTFADASIFKTLSGNWRLGRFENAFTEETGYKIGPALDSNGKVTRGIRITGPNGELDTFTTDTDLERFVGTNKGSGANRVIEQVTRKQTRWYQFLKRRNMRRFMRNAYGVTKWSRFKDRKKEKAESELRADSIDRAMGPYESQLPKLLNCALEGKTCANDKGGRDTPYGEQDVAAPKTSTDGKCDSEIADESSSGIKKAIEDVKKVTPTALTSKLLTKVLSKFISEELAHKIGSRFAPIIGQITLIDMAARLDHFFNSGDADVAIRSMHKVQYANLFAFWLSTADNFKDPSHKMSSDEVSAIMDQLVGVEGAAAHQDVFLHRDGGKTISKGDGVDDTATPIQDAYSDSTRLNILTGFLREWYSRVDGTFLHHVLDLLNAGLGLASKAGLALLRGVVPGLDNLLDGITAHISGQLIQLIPPAVDGTEKGADLLNALDVGAAVTGIDFVKNLGGGLLTVAQANQVDQSIAMEQYQDTNHNISFKDKLFSTSYNYSLTNKLLSAIPESFNTALSDLGNAQLAIFRNPFSIVSTPVTMFSSPIYAAKPLNKYGMRDWGFTDAQLDTPIEKGELDQATQAAATRLGKPVTEIKPNDIEPSDCEDTGDNPNICRADIAAIQTLNTNYTEDDDGGLGDSGSDSATTDPTQETPDTGGPLPDGDAKTLATTILNDSGITLSSLSRADIQATANDGVTINKKLLQLMLGARKAGFKFRTDILKSGHAAGTLHGDGRAMDIQGINDVIVAGPDIGNGWGVPLSDDYKSFEEWMVEHNKSGEFGVPNQEFLVVVQRAGATDAFVDKGSGPHIHVGVND